MKLGRAAGSSEVKTKMIVASGKFIVEVMVKSGQHFVNGKGIPDE